VGVEAACVFYAGMLVTIKNITTWVWSLGPIHHHDSATTGSSKSVGALSLEMDQPHGKIKKRDN
jgi:hypothetical protein